MKSITAKLVVGLTLIAIVLVAMVYMIGQWSGPFRHESKLVRRNVSLAQAQQECPIPLPPNAKNISYGLWSCGVGLEHYVRFEAPATTCLAHIPVVLAASSPDGKTGSRPSPPTPSKITSPPQPVTFHEFDVSWFDIQNIRKGVTAGTGGSHQPQVWVDTDRGVFYYHMAD